MATFEERAGPLVATTAQIAKLQGAQFEATVLEKARASLIKTGYDNWNAGTEYFTLMLEVPIPTYAALGDQQGALEKSILGRVSQLVRTDIGSSITQVVISPILAEESRPKELNPSIDTSPGDIPSFWQPGFFRLFITHVAANKASAHRLKEALAQYQVAAFVAHDDIEPTKVWQAEIERALRTMDALIAIIAPGFLESRWCNQEVGIAIGREKLVIPLCVGSDPHGFMGKYQGLAGQALLGAPAEIAEKIVQVLTQNVLSAQRMSEALVDRLVSSSSFESSKRTMTLLEATPQLNASQVARLFRSINENDQVEKAYGVPERIRSLVARFGERAV